MSKKKKRSQNNMPGNDSLTPSADDVMNVVSGTECTGMVPTPPSGDGESDSYREIYDVPVERNAVKEPPAPTYQRQ